MNYQQTSVVAWWAHDARGQGHARALVISDWLTGVYFFVELVVGIWTGSVVGSPGAHDSAGPGSQHAVAGWTDRCPPFSLN